MPTKEELHKVSNKLNKIFKLFQAEQDFQVVLPKIFKFWSIENLNRESISSFFVAKRVVAESLRSARSGC